MGYTYDEVQQTTITVVCDNCGDVDEVTEDYANLTLDFMERCIKNQLDYIQDKDVDRWYCSKDCQEEDKAPKFYFDDDLPESMFEEQYENNDFAHDDDPADMLGGWGDD